MSKTKKKQTFADFMSYFEKVEPPIIIGEDTIERIQDVTKPLPLDMVEEFISPWEGELDEFTEILPCFALPEKEEFNTIIYWKAGLLRYEYIAVTLNKKNELIARKPLCGVLVEDQIIKKSVAKIDEDFIVHIQAGAAYDEASFNPEVSQSFYIEIMDSGDMLFHIDERMNIKK